MKFKSLMSVCAVGILVAGPFAMITNGPILSAQSINPLPLDPIHFKTGTYFPPETTTRNLDTYPQHLLIQFAEAYTDQDLLLLESLGANVLSDLSRKTILAAFQNPFDPTLLDSIRWAGPIPPHAKISPHLSASTTRSSGVHDYLLDFHPDVNPASLPAIIENAGGTVLERAALPAATHLIRADHPTIERLSNRDEVSYIYPASERIINDEPVFFCPVSAGQLGPLPRSIEPDTLGWDGPGLGSAALTYNFTNGTNDISGSLEQPIVIAGIEEWSRVVDVSFAPTAIQDAQNSFQILWATGEHSAASGYDEAEYPFDGPLGVLAHAAVPENLLDLLDPLSGDIHFDDAENWAVGASTQFDLFGVSLHEAGHSLGLFHSDDPNAVMYQYVDIYSILHYDDVLSIQLLYATPPALAVYTPNGTEELPADSTQTIIWTPGDSTGSTVNIGLYKNNIFQGYIITNTANDGFHDWTIPAGLNTSDSYSIRVESASTPGLFDASDGFFKIQSIPDPGLFSPVYVDPAAASPGAGTQSTPYTIVEPALSTVSLNGQLQIQPGTYTEAPLTISTAMSLQNSTGQGIVKIR